MTVDVDAMAARPVRTAGRRTLLVPTALGLGIGTLFVLVFLQVVNLRSVTHRLEDLNLGFAVLCGVVFLSAYAVRALRWRLFLTPDKVALRHVLGIYYIATFLNWLLPVQGGEVAKGLMLRRTDRIPVSRSLATVTLDKVMDLLPCLVVLSVIPLAQLHLGGSLWLLLVFPLVLLGAGGTLLVFARWRRDRVVTLLARLLRMILPRRAAEFVEPFVIGFVDSLLELVARPRLFVRAAVYTVVAVTLDALFCYLAFRAVGSSLDLAMLLFGYTLYNLAYILPTPPGHLGSNELIGLLIFSGVFGVRESAVGAMFVFSHPFTGILMTVTALACIRASGLDLRTLFRMELRKDSGLAT